MSLRRFLISLSLLSSAAFASEHIIITPDCLLKNMDNNYRVMAKMNYMSMLSVTDEGINYLMHVKNTVPYCGGFMDATIDWADYSVSAGKSTLAAQKFLENYIKPTKPQNNDEYLIGHKSQVETLIDLINPQLMWDNLASLTSFQDRYANSDNGVKAAEWLKEKVLAYAHEYMRTDVTTYYVKTGEYYQQPSLIIKIGDSNEAGIVIGAHMDTLSGRYSKKPGADDDGSGTATVLEATRTIIASGMRFKKPIYIAWYAAEEEGLVGSGYVVKDFQSKKIPVSAVLHFDLTGYAHRNEETMWLISDNVDDKLTNYLGKLIKTYVKRPTQRTACGYACSDHATWTQHGYTAAMPAESAYEDTNPSIHSSNDTMEKLSLDHMTDYTKLAVAFAVELAEPLS